VQTGTTNTKIPVQRDSSTSQVNISIETYRKTIRPEGWISQAEAARIRGVSQQAIDNLVKRNRFKTLKLDGKTLLNLTDVRNYQPQPPGPRPDKNRIEEEPTHSQGAGLSRAKQSGGRVLSKKNESANRLTILTEQPQQSVKPEAWISQAEAARLRGVSREAIYNLVKKNRFTTFKIGDKTLINREDVENYEPHPSGRKPKKRSNEVETTLSQRALLPRAQQSESRIPSKKNESANRLRILTEQPQQSVKPEDWISQAEAARIRGVSQPAIVHLIRRGRLTTVNMAGRTVVLRSEIENFIARPKGARPPMKAKFSKTSKEKKAKK
jgi:excisionase family DNA binding protein